MIIAGSNPAGGFGHEAHQPMTAEELKQEIRQAKQQIQSYGIDDPRSEAGVGQLAYNMAIAQLLRDA